MRRALLIVGFALLFTGDGQARNFHGGQQWTCSLDALLDVETVCILRAEPGMRRYVTDVVAQSNAATGGIFGLYYGTGSACVTGGTILLPTATSAQSNRFAFPAVTAAPTELHFSPGLVVPSGQDLCVIGDASNASTLQVVGYTAP